MPGMKYPIYIPSLGRANLRMTTRVLGDHPYWLVVEPQERDAYVAEHGAEHVLTLPGSNYGGVYAARNWIKQHSRENGDAKHWQLDDNIGGICWNKAGHLVTGDAGEILSHAEVFCDRYSNIAIAGLAHYAFRKQVNAPFVLNRGVYSCVLVLNETDLKWRPNVVDDTDYALQALTSGWCTVLFYAFLIRKEHSGVNAGGNTDTTYAHDGRVKTARAMIRAWPTLSKVTRRYGKTKVQTGHVWRHFQQQLKETAQSGTPVRVTPV